MADEKKEQVTNPEIREDEEEVDNESYTDMFGKWARDKLTTGKSKIKDVE